MVKRQKEEKSSEGIIHDDISLRQFVIPGLTEPAPYLIWGNPVKTRSSGLLLEFTPVEIGTGVTVLRFFTRLS